MINKTWVVTNPGNVVLLVTINQCLILYSSKSYIYILRIKKLRKKTNGKENRKKKDYVQWRPSESQRIKSAQNALTYMSYFSDKENLSMWSKRSRKKQVKPQSNHNNILHS